MNNKIVKLQLGDYFKWKNLSREDKVKRNKQIAKLYLDKGPSILNYYNALKAYFGGFNPKNPYLLTGEPIILPGTNPTKGILTAAKVARTLEDYLKTTKVTAQALEGSSAARSAYATDRYLGGVMFENNLPEAASQIQGHGMAKASTLLENLARLRYILDNGLEKGKTFFTAPLKVSDARIGSALGTGGGKPYFDGHFLITGKPGLMINSVDDIGTIYINDAYENEEALKAAQKMKEYLTKTYPNKVFKLYSEGFKKGGSIKTANARKWKHEDGGIVYNGIKKHLEGAKLTFGLKLGNFANSDLGKSVISNGLNFLLDKLFNKSASSNLEIALAAQEKEYPTIDPLQEAQMIEIARNQYADPENPNAVGGDIVNSYIRNQLMIPYLLALKEDYEKWKLQMKQQANTLKSSLFDNLLNTGLSIGTDYLKSKLGIGTEKAGSN